VFDAPPFFVFHYGQCYEATAADGSRQLVRGAPCFTLRIGPANMRVRLIPEHMP
jgi:hypothetical protein